jgi:Asp-tRNA(Asn)/Glu-tRNA(Gln) amidotransferase A subunit family amidase
VVFTIATRGAKRRDQRDPGFGSPNRTGGRELVTMANYGPPFNISGQPTVNVPLAWSDDGLPIGVQLAGRMFDEGTA